MEFFRQYTSSQWLLFFCIYSFFGWIWECCYVSVKQRRWVNRGFLHGPWLPIYGFGALIMVVCAMPVRDSLVLTYLFGLLGATLLELVTGWAMEGLFHIRYWDYSDEPLNFRGYICLVSSLFWGLLTVLLTRFVHGPVENLVLGLREPWLSRLAGSLFVLFLTDALQSTKEALDLRRIIDRLEAAKAELDRVQAELDLRMEEKKQTIELFLRKNQLRAAAQLSVRRAQAELWLEEAHPELLESIEESRRRLAEAKNRSHELAERFQPRRARLRRRHPSLHLARRLEDWLEDWLAEHQK